MLLRLSEPLDIPLRERNELLVAGGFAPVFPERGLDAPALRAARDAVERVLKGHEPYPALAVDRHWSLLAANDAVPPLLVGVSKDLLRPPMNVLRLSLHPKGLAPRIANYQQWRDHVLERLRRQVEVSADSVLAELLDELRGYQAPEGIVESEKTSGIQDFAGVVVPFQLHTEHGLLSFFSTTTVFGTPVDVTLAELAMESFFPANTTTGEVLRRLGETSNEQVQR
jgi:hypothetical protein